MLPVPPRVHRDALACDSPTWHHFRYCFYLDYNACELDPNAQAALFHLREQSDFVRVLGSYPMDSQLVGPVKDQLMTLQISKDQGSRFRPVSTSGQDGAIGADELGESSVVAPVKRLNVGIVGFGKFGRYLAKTMTKYADVIACDKDDMSSAASELGVEFFPLFDMATFMRRPLDVIILSVSCLSFEEVLRSLNPTDLRGKLIVDVLTIKAMPKDLMKEVVPEDADILCSHPMFGPESAPNSWQGQPFVFEQVRVGNFERVHQFLNIFEAERCTMIEMAAELHDHYALEPQFVTHFVGRILGDQKLRSTPIDTSGYKHALRLAETAEDSFDLFFALYKHTPNAAARIARLEFGLNHAW